MLKKKRKEDFRSFQQIFRKKRKLRKGYAFQRYKFGEGLFLDESLSHRYYSWTRHLSLILKGFISLIVLWFYFLEASLLILFIAEVLLTVQLCPLPQAVSLLATISLVLFCRNVFLWLLWQLFITYIYKSTYWYHCSIWVGSCDSLSLPYAAVAAAPALLACSSFSTSQKKGRREGKKQNEQLLYCNKIPLHYFPPPPPFWRKVKNSRTCWWLLMREKERGRWGEGFLHVPEGRKDPPCTVKKEQWIITIQRGGGRETTLKQKIENTGSTKKNCQ